MISYNVLLIFVKKSLYQGSFCYTEVYYFKKK